MQILMGLGLTRSKADALNWAINDANCMAIFSGRHQRQLRPRRPHCLDMLTV